MSLPATRPPHPVDTQNLFVQLEDELIGRERANLPLVVERIVLHGTTALGYALPEGWNWDQEEFVAAVLDSALTCAK